MDLHDGGHTPADDPLADVALDASGVHLADDDPPGPGVYDPDGGTAGPYGPEGGLAGDPAHEAAFWHEQAASDTCAIAAQEFVLDDLTGVPHTEAELTAVAEENGWYEPGHGTAMDDVGKVLEHYGVPVERFGHATIADLEGALAGGRDVVAGVDSGEIWEAQGLAQDLDGYPGIPGQGADHVVQVTGVDRTDPAHPMVLMNDSGSPSGAGAAVPLDVFLDAWGDSGNFMIAAGGTRG
ncbi:hypothetical protein [Microbispora sp. ATCC PTA-5024]|uniref:hypothetical protein n=1 Tax=Microbispora sp. ATCC PTA-5024 TaxID=316330 RepID=UPI0003FFE61C|nr:hypothetical protein [Microbispora sp. ATCC PTA-5024]